MEQILLFFQQHGLWVTVIAVVGIILLGVGLVVIIGIIKAVRG